MSMFRNLRAVLAASVVLMVPAIASGQDKQLERTAADAGFLIDGASRCGYPTAPIENGLDSILDKRGVASSEKVRIKGFMQEARRLAGMMANATGQYSCPRIKETLSQLGVSVR